MTIPTADPLASLGAAPVAPSDGATALAQLLGVAQQTAAAPTGVNVGVVPIDDESVSSSEFDVYKVRKDFTDRITVLLPKSIAFGRAHYVEEKGYFICGSNWKKQAGQEILMPPAAICCQRLEPPKQRFSALVIHYGTTPKGAIVAPLTFSLKVWRFNPQAFEQLRTTNSEFPLDQHDLLVASVDDPKYQKVSLSACRESYATQKAFLDRYGAEVQAWVAAMLQKMEKTIGRRLDAAAWQQLLTGVAPGAAQAAVAADAPIQDISELLGDVK